MEIQINMTEILKWQPEIPLPQDAVGRISQLLKEGEVMVYPTTTLYGLGASIYSEAGMKRLWELKRRPAYMPFSVMAAEKDILKLCSVPDIARSFIDSHDISITAILPALDPAPESAVYKGTLALRLPCSKLCNSIVEAIGPITATSANVHGKGAPVTVEEARKQLGDDVPLYIDGGMLAGTPTTLVDFTGESPKILREGAISAQEVAELYGR